MNPYSAAVISTSSPCGVDIKSAPSVERYAGLGPSGPFYLVSRSINGGGITRGDRDIFRIGLHTGVFFPVLNTPWTVCFVDFQTFCGLQSIMSELFEIHICILFTSFFIYLHVLLFKNVFISL